MHKVKCPVCLDTFDADKVEWVPYGKNRYAHKSCIDKIKALENGVEEKNGFEMFRGAALSALAKNEVNSLTVMDYCHWLFSGKENPTLIGQQLNQFITGYGFTYSGVLRTLFWFYELTSHSKGDWDSIAIVPYIYKDAKQFYVRKAVSDAVNQYLSIENPCIKVFIPVPTREKKKPRLLFEDDDA